MTGNLSNPGGTERVGSIIANGLASKGYNIVFASISGGSEPFFPLDSSIKTVTLLKKPGKLIYRTPFLISSIRKMLIAEDIDILIVIESMATLFTLPATINLNIRHICWEHFNFTVDLGKYGRRLARQLAAIYCDAIVTLTERDEGLWKKNTLHNNQIVTIPNPSPYKPQYYDKSENKIALAVGRLTKQKGFDYLLQIWSIISKGQNDWQLIIVGDGENRKDLLSFIQTHNLEASVSIVGNTNDISYYYKIANILCMSSRYEGFPMVLLEALSFGLPVVSFDCNTGPSEILENTGSILVPPGDITTFASELNSLMLNQPRRIEISKKSVKKSKQYQPERIIDMWVNLIQNIN
ncbi:glycosyltransferase family 4 protein [Psychrobacter phenylpyruvicus]|nr:glycosyltransferase family 4 protein [Psychrobacter phenylpyruvicus]